MKNAVVFILLILSQGLFAQGKYRRSNGDLLSGTWKCVRCADSTVQSIAFQDTNYRETRLTPEGIKVVNCPYRIKGNKVFVKCEGDKNWKYKIVLLDYNTLALKRWKNGLQEFKKTR
jgi:hypothetical protein